MTLRFSNSATAAWFEKVSQSQGFPTQTRKEKSTHVVEVTVPAEKREVLIAKWCSMTCQVSDYSATERKKLFEPQKQKVKK
jgi:hypothetical protein